MLLVFIVIALALAALAVFFLVNSKKALAGSVKNGNTVLICGTRGSGKTTLLSRIINENPDQYLKTQTSQIENNVQYKSGAYVLTDIPGHDRVRARCLEKYTGQARALIFVIDAENVREDVRDSVDFFVKIAANPTLFARTSEKYKLPVLFVCNKQDAAMAKSPNAVQSLFEREIEVLKKSRCNTLLTTGTMDNDADENDPEALNARAIFFNHSDKEKFAFSTMSRFDIKFVPVSCVEDKDQYDFASVKNWLDNNTPVEA